MEFIVTRSPMQEAFVNQATRVALAAGADAGLGVRWSGRGRDRRNFRYRTSDYPMLCSGKPSDW
jgi:hypothetical protein